MNRALLSNSRPSFNATGRVMAVCTAVLLTGHAPAQSNALRLSNIAPVNRTNLLLQWQGATGQVCVQMKVGAGEWTDVSPTLTTNRFVATIDPTARGAVLYRLRVPGAAPPKLAGFLSAVGVAHDVVVRSNVAYVASDTFGLSLVNVSTPTAPRLVDSANVPFNGQAIALVGNTACVIGTRSYGAGSSLFTNLAGFYTIDVSTTNPVVRGMLESGDTAFSGVAASGTCAYVACGADGVRVIDLSDPASPRFLGTNDTPGNANAIAVAGQFAYVADGASGLRILNISNPAVPAFAGVFDTPGNARDVAVAGTLALVADGNSLQVIDVANPSATFRRGALTLAANRVTVQGGIAYVSVGGGGLALVSILNPVAPFLLSMLPPAGHPNASTLGASVSGALAIIANREGGLAVADVSSFTAPAVRATIMEWFEGYKIATQPGLAVVTGTRYWDGGAQSMPGLRVLAMTNPATPVVLATLDAPGLVLQGVALSGNRAYVACGGAGLRIVSLTDPARPVFIGTNDTPGFAYAVTVTGNFAYVADGTMGLRVLNISNPAAPTSAGSLDTPGTVRDVSITGSLACIADGNSVRLVDVSNPASPVARGAANCAALEAKIQGTLAYVAVGGGGMQIYNVANPSAPALVSSIPPSGHANASTLGVTVRSGFAYLANREGGLAVIDVSVPSQPVLRHAVSTLSSALGVSADSSWVCLSDTLGTLSTVPLTP